MAHAEQVKLGQTLFYRTSFSTLRVDQKLHFCSRGFSREHKRMRFLQMESHSLQTGWHCVHQATLGLNKGSYCRLPTGYPTQWNPGLQVSL